MPDIKCVFFSADGTSNEYKSREDAMSKGMSLIETLFFIAITTLAFTAVSAALVHCFHQERWIRRHFILHQRIGDFQNEILSDSFECKRLSIGDHEGESQFPEFRWRVDEIGVGLKRIVLYYSYNNQERSFSFYKSRTIKEVLEHERTIVD